MAPEKLVKIIKSAFAIESRVRFGWPSEADAAMERPIPIHLSKARRAYKDSRNGTANRDRESKCEKN